MEASKTILYNSILSIKDSLFILKDSSPSKKDLKTSIKDSLFFIEDSKASKKESKRSVKDWI